MMHDISGSLGFTEEFGNFQQKNYTGLGEGQDYVLAQAFDGIELHEGGFGCNEIGIQNQISIIMYYN